MPPQSRQNATPDIVLDVEDVDPADFEAGILTPDDMPWAGNEPRETVINPDVKVGKAPRTLKAGAQAASTTMPPKTGIPTVDEWYDFFSRVLLRACTDWLIDWTFRGIDENLLSDREVNSIKLTDEERGRIAKPLSEMAYKNRFLRRHGREIIATAGSIDAMLQLGLWYSRINRIALKYRRLAKQGVNVSPPRQQQPQQPVSPHQPAQGEVIPNERLGPSSPDANANGHQRIKPDVAGDLWNPDRA